MRAKLQSAIRLLYPPQCLICDAETTEEFGLCSNCWRDSAFITGTICDSCGAPLPGDQPEEIAQCDTCLAESPPWRKGRAVFLYEGSARRLVMKLKYGDRLDLAPRMAKWMYGRLEGLITPDTLIAPVPLHRWRLVSRLFNQSALLALALGRLSGAMIVPDLLQRTRSTLKQEGMTRQERFVNQNGAFTLADKHTEQVQGRHVLLVDDVMTSGATLGACTEACLAAGVASVDVAILARVATNT